MMNGKWIETIKLSVMRATVKLADKTVLANNGWPPPCIGMFYQPERPTKTVEGDKGKE